MDLVVDANVLFASLIKQGKTIELLFNEDFRLFAPEFILEELSEHEEEILQKSKRTREEFCEILAALEEVIMLVPNEEFAVFFQEARKISPDPDDFQYFALALKLKCAI